MKRRGAAKRHPRSQRKKSSSHRSSLKRASHRPRPPANAAQKAAYERALQALSLMRRGASMSAATRAKHIKPSTFRRYVGNAIRRDTPSAGFRAVSTDKLVRTLQVRTHDGELVRVPARTLRAARELSAYENGIAHFLRTGDASRLQRFAGKTVATDDGRRIALVTDPDRLRELAGADLLRLDSLYAAVTSKP